MNSKITDYIIEKIIFLCGIIAIVFVVLIFGFLLKEGFAFFKEYGIFNFIFGKYWYPSSNPASYGVFSLIIGSLLVTLGAAIIAVPFGIMTALFIAELAPKGIRDILKSIVELMAAIPSVVLGFVGMVTLVPLVRSVLDIPTGLTAFSGSIVLGFMAMPTIVSISEDAIRSVPWQYKEGAFALGATKWQTIRRVVLPNALPGIMTGAILSISRISGETAPILFTAAAFYVPHLPKSMFDQVMALPYHLYIISTQIPNMPKNIIFGTALVLLLMVLSMSLIAIVARLYFRKIRKW